LANRWQTDPGTSASVAAAMVRNRWDLSVADRNKLAATLPPNVDIEATAERVSAVVAEYHNALALGANDRPLPQKERERVGRELEGLAEATSEYLDQVNKLSAEALGLGRTIRRAPDPPDVPKVPQVNAIPGSWAPIIGDELLGQLRRVLLRVRAGAWTGAAEAREVASGKAGAPRDLAADRLTTELCAIWQESTRKRPYLSKSAKGGGPFARFVSAVFEIGDAPKGGAAARRHLAEHHSSGQVP